MNGRDLALGLVGALALAGAVRRRGGANVEREIFVTTLTGDEVFGHVTPRAGAETIQRQGFRVGEGKYGTGVYLLSPEEEWGGGLPPAATSAHAFRLRWHEGRTDLRVLRVSLPAGTRLLRVVASPGEATLEAMKVLHGDTKGTERNRTAWRQGQEEAVLHDDLRAAGIDGIYWLDPVWNADEILVLDPARLSVVREQVQEGSRARTTPRTDPALWEAVKAEVTASDKGGRPGQWSARKAQRSVQLYKERGGGYLGPKDPDNALARWTKQDWRTRSGGESLETGERYLPAAAFDLLTPAEVGATTRAKRAGLARGQQFTPQPANIARKTKKAREGAANVIAPSGYDQTARTRTGPSAPAQHLHAHAPELLRGRVLDFGSGRGADAEALRATAYDPHHPKASVRKRPTGTFSTVLATYVLNVLPKDERHAALREAAGYVRPGGHLVLAVRPQAEVAATVTGWARHGDGHQILGEDGARTRFQRGYTDAQLAREVRAVLGDAFQPIPLPALAGSVMGVWRRA